MRVILIGSVASSQTTLKKLLQYRLEVVAVFGLERPENLRVSGYTSLKPDADAAQVPFYCFTKINDHAEFIKSLYPDLVFVVGLSQLVCQEILNAPTYGCVGFHPTKLPLGRGRAPLAWLVHDQKEGAATFFKIADGVDDGPIYVQKPFPVNSLDTAQSVSKKIQSAIIEALDEWLPAVKQGDLSAFEQNHRIASYNGIRKQEDGCLDWSDTPEVILRLVRTASKPHPGAFTYCGEEKIIIWDAERETNLSIRGVVGRILHISENGQFVVQTGEQGLLRVKRYESTGKGGWLPKIGEYLGYNKEIEIHQLKCKLKSFEQRIEKLENLLLSTGNVKEL